MEGEIVIVARPSLALELALDALEELTRRVRLHSSPQDLSDWLLQRDSAWAPFLTVIVIATEGVEPAAVDSLIAQVRGAQSTALVPIVVWGGADSVSGDSRPSSVVPQPEDATEAAGMLARALYYWAVVNRSPDPVPVGSSEGGPG
jgi:hypothetical protein